MFLYVLFFHTARLWDTINWKVQSQHKLSYLLQQIPLFRCPSASFRAPSKELLIYGITRRTWPRKLYSSYFDENPETLSQEVSWTDGDSWKEVLVYSYFLYFWLLDLLHWLQAWWIMESGRLSAWFPGETSRFTSRHGALAAEVSPWLTCSCQATRRVSILLLFCKAFHTETFVLVFMDKGIGVFLLHGVSGISFNIIDKQPPLNNACIFWYILSWFNWFFWLLGKAIAYCTREHLQEQGHSAGPTRRQENLFCWRGEATVQGQCHSRQAGIWMFPLGSW